MLNSIFLMGRLTREPELKTTQSGVSVVGFTLAVDRDIKNSAGEKVTDFINCTAWRNTAEFISKWFGKGAMMVANGSLQMRSYTDKDGNSRTAAEVIVDKCWFGESKKESHSASASASANASLDSIAGKPTVKFVEDDSSFGDLPF